MTDQLPASIEPETLKRIYTQISRIHAVDDAILKGLTSGRFQITYWPMTGHEAIPACLQALLDDTDYMVTIYRGLHDQVAKGVPLKGLFAEAMGKTDGLNKGKGGAPHISDPDSGSMVTTAIVGAGAPIANGLALAQKLRGTGRVTIVNFGDGATSIGAVHEAMNLAGVWKLPVIFVIQNNLIGEYTPVPEYTATKHFVDRAVGYGIKGLQADGRDVVDMYQKAREAVEHARSGQGAVLLEAVVDRLGPHAGPGGPDHLSKEEHEIALQNWSVPRSRQLVLDSGACSEAEVDALDAAAAAEVEEAIEFALNSSDVSLDELLVDVFEDPAHIPRRGHYESIATAEASPDGDSQKMGLSGAIQNAMDIAMAKNDEVILLGEDVGDPPGGVFKTSDGLQNKYGENRILPTPIAEQAIIGAGMGASIVGMRPICELMFSDFTAVCMDQLANHAAKQRFMSGGKTNVPMTIRVICGGGGGGFGAQHSQSMEAWLLHTPGLKVVFPSTPYDAKGLLTTCIWDNDPCVHMEAIALLFSAQGSVPVGEYSIPLGLADVKRPGKDLTVVTYGWQVPQALGVAEALAAEGIDVEVVDLRSLVPLDYTTVFESARKTGRVLALHAATEFCGLGAEIASTVNSELWRELKQPVQRLGAVYAPIAVANPLEIAQIPNGGSITARIKEMMQD